MEAPLSSETQSDHKETDSKKAMALRAALKTVIISPKTTHTATVIISHGLGDTGHGWSPVGERFQRDSELGHIKWIFPHAPIKRVTVNMGGSMPAWFDIFSFGPDSPEDEEGMLESKAALSEIINQEIQGGIPPSRIVLGGFSQGGAMSLLTGLTGETKLAGLVCISGWLIMRNKFKAMANSYGTSLPIFWGHGEEDPLITYKLAQSSKKYLVDELSIKQLDITQDTADNIGLAFHGYKDLGHSVNSEELDDLQAWIKRILPKAE